MMGERVAVLRATKAGEDEMGEPTVSWRSEVVDNVLVKPASTDDVRDPKRPDGVTVEYSLAFPKPWTKSAEPLRGCRVALVDRGMDPEDEGAALRVSGCPDRISPCPTAWDLIAEAGRADG